MKFKNYIEAQSGIKDSSDLPGTLDQVLTSTATGVAWVDPSTISAEAATLVVIECKNTSGLTINKGTPVYQTGTVGATDVIEIAPADALISAGAQPAIGLLQTTLNNNGLGKVVITGEFLNFTTDPIDGVTPTTGDKVFLKSGGGLTLTKPTGAGNGIQSLGLIGKVSSGAAGSITVSSIMRTNDVPNLPTGKIWVGDGNTVVSDTVFLDEPNGRMGIGTTSPAVPLDVEGKIRSKNDASGDYLEMFNDGSVSGQSFITTSSNDLVLIPQTGVLRLQGQDFASGNNASMEIYDALNTAVKVKLNSSGDSYLNGGNVGIGTTSPGAKLDVVGSGLATMFRVSNTTADATTKYGAFVGRHYTNSEENIAGMQLQSSSGATGNALFIGGGTGAAAVNAVNNIILYTAANSTTLVGTERMRINSSGNVGIGTAAPAAELEVQGDIQLGSYLYFNNNDSRPKSIDGSGGGFSFRTNSTDRLKIAFNGNVGIGTSPSQKLDVAGNIRVANGTAAYFGSDTTGGFIQTFNNQTFRFLGTTGNETVRVNNATGKVGIGTTNPEGKLHIAESIDNTTGLKFTTTTGGNNDEVNMHFQGSNPFSPFYISRKQTGGAEIQLQQDGDIILNGSNGDNVGIGTTNPVFNSILEISSTTKGVLLPRLTTTQVNAIASPGNGLTVYNTTLNTLCFYNGTSWQKVSHTNM